MRAWVDHTVVKRPITTTTHCTLYTALASSALYKRRTAGAVCVSAAAKTTAGVLSLSDTKETMRATLERIILLLGGYFTVTNGSSKLLQNNSKYNFIARNGCKDATRFSCGYLPKPQHRIYNMHSLQDYTIQYTVFSRHN